MLAIPPSTIRRYVKDYAEHLSKTATKKRGRRFTELDIALLASVRELLQQGRSPHEVGPLLAVISEEDAEISPDAALMLVPSISQALSQALNVAQSLRIDVDDLADRQTSTDERLAELEKWLRLPWYRRFFSQPPVDRDNTS